MFLVEGYFHAEDIESHFASCMHVTTRISPVTYGLGITNAYAMYVSIAVMGFGIH
jgi:hypothetical protein